VWSPQALNAQIDRALETEPAATKNALPKPQQPHTFDQQAPSSNCILGTF
jgi:hypothetical protein